MGCTHRGELRWRRTNDPHSPFVDDDGRRVAVFAEVCSRCHDWLPLGPANDTPEVLVEVRAAELAQATREEDGCEAETWTEEEADGWNYHQCDWPTMGDAERAGWLAREIWTSEQESDRG